MTNISGLFAEKTRLQEGKGSTGTIERLSTCCVWLFWLRSRPLDDIREKSKLS